MFGAQVARLDAAGLPAGIPGPGAVMPDGDLLDAHGEPTSLVAARSGRPAVVVFYRGQWCPYCKVRSHPQMGYLVGSVVYFRPEGVVQVKVASGCCSTFHFGCCLTRWSVRHFGAPLHRQVLPPAS